MYFNIKEIRDNSLPDCLSDFLTYLQTIKGKSPNTLDGYKIDLIMFFRFLMIYKGEVTSNIEFEKRLNFSSSKFNNDKASLSAVFSPIPGSDLKQSIKF